MSSQTRRVWISIYKLKIEVHVVSFANSRREFALNSSWHASSVKWLLNAQSDCSRREHSVHVVNTDNSDTASKFVSQLQKIISFAYELRFRRSLYPCEGETTIYNFRLDSVG